MKFLIVCRQSKHDANCLECRNKYCWKNGLRSFHDLALMMQLRSFGILQNRCSLKFATVVYNSMPKIMMKQI